MEPYSNKPKEEIIATIIHWFNQSLNPEDRFIVTGIAAQDIFPESHIQRGEDPPQGIEEDSHRSAGWIVAPTEYAWATALWAYCNAHSISIPLQVRILAEQLEIARAVIAPIIEKHK